MRVEVFSANSGELSKREDIEVDTVGHGLGVCLIEGKETYLCLADGGTFPKEQLVKHMNTHTCQKVANEIICNTCHKVAGTGAVPARMHCESAKHATIVAKLKMNVCLDCLVLCNDSHKCTRNVRKLADVQRDAGMTTEVREYEASADYKTHLVKTSYGSGQDDKSVDYMVTMICMCGKKVSGSRDVTLPPLCQVHLGRMHISVKRAYANISIVEGTANAKCKACANARRITNGPEPQALPAYYVMTNASNLEYPYAHKVLSKKEEGGLKENISPQEFGDLSDTVKKRYVFDGATYRFVLVGYDEEHRYEVNMKTQYHGQCVDPQSVFESDDDEPPRQQAGQQDSRTDKGEATGSGDKHPGKKSPTDLKMGDFLLSASSTLHQADDVLGGATSDAKEGSRSRHPSGANDTTETAVTSSGGGNVNTVNETVHAELPKTFGDVAITDVDSPDSDGSLKGSRVSLDKGAIPKTVIKKCLIKGCKRTLTGDNTLCASHRRTGSSASKQTSK